MRADVFALSAGPRNRRHPGGPERARAYVTARLQAAGWQVTPHRFTRRWAVGVSDAGATGRWGTSVVRRLRLFAHLGGTNLLAHLPPDLPPDLPSDPSRPTVLLVAHLDSVACGPGADDNASGVAALLECARLLASLPVPAPVTLAVVDLEEVGRIGSTALARDRSLRRGLRAVVCLESVGTYDDTPGSQRLGSLGLVFPALRRRVRADGNRGTFVLALCRRSSAPAARAVAAAAAALAGLPALPVLTVRDPRPDGPIGLAATCLFPPLAAFDRSDHAPFWNRGVPSLMLTTTAPFRNRHYHRPGDRPENVDVERVTALTVAVAVTLATWPPGT